MAESTSKLREQIAALTNVTGKGGFDIMEDEDTFKSTYDIMLGIGQVWEQMSDIDQAALLELLAGKRQGNALAATLTNLEDMQKALEVSENSAGSAMREHETWLNSIDAKTQQFKASVESLSSTVFSTDMIKGIVDMGTGFIQTVDKTIQGLQNISGLLPAIKGISLALAVPMAANSIGKFFLSTDSEGMSRIGRIGDSFRTTGKRIKNAFTDGALGGVRKGAGKNGGDVIFRPEGFLKLASAVNIYTAGLAAAVAALVALYAITQKVEADREKRRANAEKDAENLKERTSSLNELKERYKQLSNELSSGDLSADESLAKRMEIADIQKQISALVGDEAGKLDLVNGKLSEQLNLLDDIQAAQFGKWKSDNQEALDRAKLEYNAGFNKVYDMSASAQVRGNRNDKAYEKAYNDYVAKVRESLGNDIANQFAGKAFDEWSLNLSDLNAEDALDTTQKLVDLFNEMDLPEGLRDKFSGLISGLEGAEKATQALVDRNKLLIQTYAEGELNTNRNYKDLWSGLLDAQNEYYEASEKGDVEAQKKALDRLRGYEDQYIDEVKNGKLKDESVNNYLEDYLESMFQDIGDKEVEINAKYNIKQNADSLKKMMADVKNTFSDLEGFSGVIDIGFTAATGGDLSRFSEEQVAAFGQIAQAASDAGIDVGNFMKLLSEEGVIQLNDSQLKNLDSFISTIADNAEALNNLEIAFNVDMNGDGEIGKVKEDIEEVEGDHDANVNVKTKGTENAQKAKNTIESIPEKKQSILSAVDKAKKTADGVKTAVKNIPSSHNTSLTATDSATPVIQKVKNAIATVSRNITIWLTAKFGGLLGGGGEWTGTTHATEGLTLVGERGEELVQSKDKAYFVGTDHPEIVYLKQGDIVYNAEETKQIKSGNKVVKRGVMPALASGTDNTGRLAPSSRYTGKTRSSFGFLAAGTDSFEAEKKIEKELEEIKKKIDETLGNWEHQTLIMEHNGVSSKELIQVYKEAQAYISQQAAEYRKKGLNDNSDYIQNLQKQWWEYADKIKELIIEQYEETRKLTENAIDLNTNWLNDAIAKKNYEGVLQYSQNIVQNYKYMQEQIHDQAEYYRSLGYTDTSDEVSELSKLWYEYRDKIIEATSQAYAEMVDSAGEAVDSIQSLYSTLLQAGEEYADSGHITIDTFQELVGLGTKYLAHLIDENGQLVINEESIKRVLAAKTKELAVNEALNYVAQIRAAVESGNIDQINALCDATNDLTDASWSLVYAQLSQLDLSDEQYFSALANINRLRSLSENAINNIDHELASMKGDVGDILEYVKEMVKQEVENHIEALEDQIKHYNEIVDLQKESLKLQKEKDEYTKNVAKQTKSIAELQAKIAQLDLDDSREAQAQKLKLQEELAEKQESLADDQSDHSYNATVDALDKMADAYEKEKNKEIEILKNTISSEEKIYQMAIKRIDTGWDSLYGDLIHWNTEYGSHLNDEITEAWQEALKMAQEYGDYLTFLNVKKTIDANGNVKYDESEAKNKNIVGKSTTDNLIVNNVNQMAKNSSDWHSANESERKRLHEENTKLKAEIEALVHQKIKFDEKSGEWYLSDGRKLYDVYKYYTYHKGGIVGDKKLFDDEQYALLQKGEVVLTPSQQENLYRRLDAFETMYDKFGKFFSLSGAMPMNTSLYSPDDIATMRNSMTDNSVTTLATTVNVSIHGAIDDAAMAKKYGEQIGNETIKSINDAFYKRGINRSGNVLLKQ